MGMGIWVGGREGEWTRAGGMGGMGGIGGRVSSVCRNDGGIVGVGTVYHARQ